MGVEIKEFLEFIRLRVCLYVTSLALTGFIIAEQNMQKSPLLALTAFSATAAMYSLNQLSDEYEDLLNKKKINHFVRNGYGRHITLFLLLSTLLLALMLTKTSLLLLILSLSLGIIYSKVKVKKISPIKNLYAMLSISLMFLVGATAYNVDLGMSLLSAYLAVSLYVLSISVMADLRDYVGDRMAGVKSIPAMWGYEKGKIVLCSLILVFMSMVLVDRLMVFYILFLFTPLVLFNILRDRIYNAYKLLSISFLSLPLAAVMIIL
ncbi:MAG: hypothetical protein B6U97_04220 [Candidatus Altiarchaeales archaeon ex4484_96]|nr:MAG: hypothetical protein B6U97_04220 [Candidatus Altiarchaeales archaeon ex4484_96]